MLSLRVKRFVWVAVGVATIAVAVALVLRAFNSNLVFFFTPTEVSQNKAPKDRTFRIGGLVTEGSVQRKPDGLTVAFTVTDTMQSIPVRYTGILPDLFKEGKGVVAQGKIGGDGVFTASEVLAKHDENYMPPEAAEALKRAGHPIEGKVFAGQKPVVTQTPEKKY
ncbi:MAG: cytochrome c maturation protein CcmE [Rhodocyclaceae bacterium]|jgi:cytochrome c-type biogenesis protein CcmE|nr:cytochrome c maturation protein CcmE [Rhodocyclaceae bacterium]MCA3026258.1 cytochrome c maturation protein CcmE [Rhodocyclaceae bacterium]MCA3029863.1 cytochrome c maturation protein CcmE [Rhodocyclaceae bacterium]MCA3032082.1 cytochrome c maturation protein CcmE [Rhodocyclaceae bacterium]MCA3035313.1 cytochrome c maturation protein CcmE [Rhodocyclaceae bacterium]